MALTEYGAGRDVGCLCLLDRQLHRLRVDVEAEPPMAIDDGGGRRFLHDRPLGPGHDVPDLDAVDIGRDGDHAVRVMAGEIGIDAADRHGVRFLFRGACSPEQRRANAREMVGLHQRHGISSARSPREKRILLVVRGMLSKPSPKSK